MSPWLAKVVVIAASVAMVAIRAPYGQRSRGIAVVENRKGGLEVFLLAVAGVAFFVPLIWIASPLLDFADYPPRWLPLFAGTAIPTLGLWLFHRSHVDLGPNWSLSLELRENHRMVTTGLYRRVRHPMYLALLLYGMGPGPRPAELCRRTVLRSGHAASHRLPARARGADDA